MTSSTMALDLRLDSGALAYLSRALRLLRCSMPERHPSPTTADNDSAFSVHFVSSIQDIGQQQWNACAGTDNPFVRYEFLAALEETGCTNAQTGWRPHHAVVSAHSAEEELTGAADSETVAVVPLYLKTHSYGEYVFDWSWANAYQSRGLNYYPKLLTETT